MDITSGVSNAFSIGAEGGAKIMGLMEWRNTKLNIVKNITIELTPDDLKEIVAAYFKTEGYEVDKKNVRFNVGRHLEGNGMGEYEVTELTGCSVTAKMDGAKDKGRSE